MGLTVAEQRQALGVDQRLCIPRRNPPAPMRRSAHSIMPAPIPRAPTHKALDTPPAMTDYNVP